MALVGLPGLVLSTDLLLCLHQWSKTGVLHLSLPEGRGQAMFLRPFLSCLVNHGLWICSHPLGPPGVEAWLSQTLSSFSRWPFSFLESSQSDRHGSRQERREVTMASPRAPNRHQTFPYSWVGKYWRNGATLVSFLRHGVALTAPDTCFPSQQSLPHALQLGIPFLLLLPASSSVWIHTYPTFHDEGAET